MRAVRWFLLIYQCIQVLSIKRVDRNVLLTTPELIRRAGYPIEIHQVETDDGYLITHHRIPYGKKGKKSEKRRSVILQHGLLGSSSDWVIKGAPKGVAYYLADNGYDVWLMNTRGNVYSEKHKKWDVFIDRREFWNFSWHEMGIYDLPNTIDYVRNLTQNDKVFHIGHSQGTTALFVMLSERPEYNEKLYTHLSYSPIAFHKHTINFFFRLLAPIEAVGGLTALKLFIGEFNFAPRPIFIQFLTAKCQDNVKTQFICSGLQYSLMGYNPSQMNTSLLPMIFAHFPAGSSMMQVAHYIQEMNSGKFRQFDYGLADNLRIYNESSPPDYKCSNIKIPVSTFYGGKDTFAQLEDVQKFQQLLPNLRHKIYIAEWAHMDFLFGIDATELIYKKTIKLLREFNE